MVNNLDHSINKFRNLTFSYTKPAEVSSVQAAAKKHHRDNNYEYDYEKATDHKLAKSK